jgi:prepilin-type N-terminal cleavage/methylation domain-containing protein
MKRPALPPAPFGGFTLIELTAVLFLLSLVLGAAVPAFRRQLDHMAVVAAREEIMGLFHRARAVAVARGGATILLTSQPPTVSLKKGDEVLSSISLEREHRVSLTLSRNRAEAELSFGPLGLGQVASQTLLLGRGDCQARLVVSSFGRLVRE